MRVVVLQARRPAEERDLDLDLPLVVVDLLDRSTELVERTLDHLDDLTHREGDLLDRTRLRLFGNSGPAENLGELVLAKRLWLRTSAQKLDDALDVVDHMGVALVIDHLDQHISGVEAPGNVHPLSVPQLNELLGRNLNLLDLLVFDLAGLVVDPSLDQALNL